MKVELDKFYTNDNVVDWCLSKIDTSLYDLIIEPSAGNGAFSKKLNCIAYDIDPEPSSADITKQDFLKIEKPLCDRLLIIGNPPFGERCSLAKSFIRKSIEIEAKTIAFILPNTFNKFSLQRVFPHNWKLLGVYPLKRDSFNIKGNLYHVPCSFFIWSCYLNGEDLREKEVKDFKDFEFLHRGDTTADFTINGNSGKVKEIKDVSNPKAEHYIRGSSDIKKILSSINWEFNSSVNGGISWLGKQEIIKQYLKYINKQ